MPEGILWSPQIMARLWSYNVNTRGITTNDLPYRQASRRISDVVCFDGH